MSESKTQHELNLERAITLTAAFIANGDIRLGGSTSEDSTALAMVRDLIDSLYKVVGDVEIDLHERSMRESMNK